jgi:hypothetical protein
MRMFLNGSGAVVLDMRHGAGHSGQDTMKKKLTVVALVVSPVVCIACFVALALLPATQETTLKDPLRSILTGLGVLAIAVPPCLGGHILRRRAVSSPYFEGTFIATAILLFGLVCLAAGLACIILGLYDLVLPFFVPPPKPEFY